jgi:hypothetical protein
MTIGDARLGTAKGDLRIGTVMSRLIDTLRTNVDVFLPIALVTMAPTLFLNIFAVLNPDAAGVDATGKIVAGEGLHYAITGALSICAFFLGGVLTPLAVSHATVSYLSGQKEGVGPAISVALRAFLPMVLIFILEGLGVGLAFLLLVVPGCILLCMWALVMPVYVMEQTGVTESFARSRELTRGHRGTIFLLFLIYGLLAIAVIFCSRPLLGLTLLRPQASEFSVATVLVQWLGEVASYVVQPALFAVVYHELRTSETGIGSSELVRAFD